MDANNQTPPRGQPMSGRDEVRKFCHYCGKPDKPFSEKPDVELLSQLSAAAKRVEELEQEVRCLKRDNERLSAGGWTMEQAIAAGITVDEIYREEKEEYEQKINSLAAELNAREEEFAKVKAERDRLRAAVEAIAFMLKLAVKDANGEWIPTDKINSLNLELDCKFSLEKITTALSAKGEGANE